MSISSKDEILTALTSSVRLISVAQVAELVGLDSENKATTFMRQMSKSGLVESVGGLMLPSNFSVSLLVCWKANGTE